MCTHVYVSVYVIILVRRDKECECNPRLKVYMGLRLLKNGGGVESPTRT